MSTAYDRFNDAWAKKCLEAAGGTVGDSPNGAGDPWKAAEMAVVEDWLRDGGGEDLINWFNSNYDVGGGDAILDRLTSFFFEVGNHRLLVRLWKGAIANRRDSYWRYAKAVKDSEPYLTAQGLHESLLELENRKEGLLRATGQLAHILRGLGREEEIRAVEEEERLLASGKRVKYTGPRDSRKMTEDLFWSLIARAGEDGGTCAEVCEKLTVSLSAFGSTAIRTFHKICLDRMDALCTWNLWALAFIVRGGCGDDGFDYFRAWLVSRGKEVFDGALGDFDAFSLNFDPAEDPQCEALFYVADEAHELRCGKPMAPIRHGPRKPSGLEWKEEDLPAQYPELWNKHAAGRTPQIVMPG